MAFECRRRTGKVLVRLLLVLMVWMVAGTMTTTTAADDRSEKEKLAEIQMMAAEAAAGPNSWQHETGGPGPQTLQETEGNAPPGPLRLSHLTDSIDVDFKFVIGAGKEECFYQDIINKSGIYLTYEVLRGGDKNIDFYIKNSAGIIIHKEMWQSRGTFTQGDPTDGVHEMCFDNTYSHFSEKLVNFFFSAYDSRSINEYFTNVENMDVAVNNISDYLDNVRENIHKSLVHVILSRSSVMSDFYNLKDNSSHVLYWSLLQCLVIISTSCLQIYFVRRLFRVSNVTSSMKPRA
ncbi:transmembrane emp24 domain-containing protein 1-like [Argonauta hians]